MKDESVVTRPVVRGTIAPNIPAPNLHNGPEQPSVSTIDRFLSQAKNGLFGALYVMSKNTHHTESWMLATFVIEFFHLLAFTFSEEAAFPWDPRVASILHIARYARFDLISFFGGHNELIWFTFATIVVIGILSMTVHVSLAFTRNKIGSILPLRILREFAATLVSFLFVPFLSTFAQTSHCHGHSFLSFGVECNSSAQHALAALSISLAIIMFCFAMLFGSCFYNCDPSRNDPDSRPHARFDVIYQMVVATITMVFNLTEVSNKDTHLGLSVLFIIGSVIVTGSVIFFLPYYSTKFVYLRAALCSVWLWCNICLMIAVIANDPASPSFSSLLFVGMPVTACLAVFATKTRISNLQDTPPSQLISPFEVEMKARFYLGQHGLLYRQKSDAHDDDQEKVQHLRYVKDKIYLENMHRFPTSSILRIFAAHYFAYHMDNQQMALVLFESAIKRNPRLDELFRIHRHRMLTIERRDVNDGNVLAGIEYEQTSLQALSAIRSTLLAQKAFWSVLLEPTPDLSRLQSFGSRISRHINTADHKCRHLLTLDPDAPEALRMYGLFLQHALNDPEGEVLQQRANTIEDQGRKQGSSPIYMKYIPVFKIALNTGIIQQVNRAACKLVGRTAVQLEGFSINTVLPEVIAANHDRLMKRFSQDGDSQSIITMERELFFQHSRGHIVIVQGTLRNCPDAIGTEPSILASVCSDPILNDPSHHHLLIDLTTTKIMNYTEQALDWLRIPKHTRLTQTLFLSQYVKEITSETVSDYMVEDGVVRHLRLDDGAPVHVRIRIRRLLTPPYGMVRFYIMPITIMVGDANTNSGSSHPTGLSRKSVVRDSSKQFRALPDVHSSMESSSSRRDTVSDGPDNARLNDDQSMLLGIRHKLMRRASQMDHGVILLALAILTALAAILALTVSDQMYVSSHSDANLQNMRLIQQSADQQYDLARVLFRLQQLQFADLHDTTWVVRDSMEKIGAVRGRLSGLFISRTSLQDPVAVAFQKRFVPVNSSSSLSSRLSYGDALYSVMDTSRSALNRILSFDARLSRDLYLINTHGPDTARAVLAELSRLLLDAARDQIAAFLYFKQIYLLVSLLLIAFLFLFAFVPTIFHFEREDNMIASIFLAIPRQAVEGLRQATIRSLQIWKESSDDADGFFDADVDGVDSDEVDDSSIDQTSAEISNYKLGSVETTQIETVDAGQFDAPVDDGPFRTELETTTITEHNTFHDSVLTHGARAHMMMKKAQGALGRTRLMLLSRRRYLGLVLQIGFLLAIWTTYTTVSYVQDSDELRKENVISQEMFLSGMIPAQIQIFLYFSTRAAQNEPEQWIERATGALRSVETMFQAVQYGGSVRLNDSDLVFPSIVYDLDGAVGRYPARDALLFQNACVFTEGDLRDKCYSFGINNSSTPYLYSTGLANSLSSLVGLAWNVHDQLVPGNLSIQDLLRSPHLSTVDVMISDIMGSLLQTHSDMFLAEAIALQQSYNDERQVLLIIFVIVLVGSVVFLYWPMLKRLDLGIKCTRSMILLVPAQILNSVPEIRDKLRTI